jgi:hypothetical protein
MMNPILAARKRATITAEWREPSGRKCGKCSNVQVASTRMLAHLGLQRIDSACHRLAAHLFAFLCQVIRDGKDATCQAAVARISNFLIQMGRRAPHAKGRKHGQALHFATGTRTTNVRCSMVEQLSSATRWGSSVPVDRSGASDGCVSEQLGQLFYILPILVLCLGGRDARCAC